MFRQNRLQLLTICILLITNSVCGQKYAGLILNKKHGFPIEYANIGVVGKNIGTVSEATGKYSLLLDPQFDNDTLLISSIGYYPYSIKVADFKKLKTPNIQLDERVFELNEVVVSPKIFKEKTLGVTTQSKVAQAGFKENQLGYECGILMHIKKSAMLKKITINFASCSYDTIFYRINIYKVDGNMKFENILQEPIYLKLPKDKVEEKVIVDLKPYDLIVNSDILVSLEQIKDLGPGYLFFCAGLADKTYFRKTSQGSWETAPVGISISLDAKVEK
jgi:hypothetical protein